MEFTNLNKNNFSNYSILCWNARSLNNFNNFNEFKSLLSQKEQSYDIIVITESWFNINSSKLDVYNLRGYKHEKIIRDEKRGGGLSVYIMEEMVYRVKRTVNENIQMFTLEVQLNNDWMKIVTCYRPPDHANMKNFLKILEYEMDDVIPTLMIGDMNIDIKKFNKSSHDYVELLKSYDAAIINTETTRHESNSIIDHVVVKNFDDVREINTINNSKSDHNMLSITILRKEKPQGQQIVSREQINYEKLAKEFKINWNKLSSYEDPSDILSSITHQLKDALEKCTTRSCFKLRKKLKIFPYYNFEILKLIKWKENVLNKIRKLKKLKKPVNQLETRIEIIQGKLKSAVDKAVSNHYEGIANECNINKIWRELNELIGNRTKSESITIESSGKIIGDEKEITEIFQHHFIEISKSLDPDIRQIKMFNKYNTIKHVHNTFFLTPTDNNEIEAIIKNLCAKKATGIDGISTKVIKSVIDEITPALCELVNAIFVSSKFPDTLKKAIIRPIFKKEGEKINVENYRPISVLPVFSKIVEICLLARVNDFMTSNGIGDNMQFAFRKKSGTDLAVTELFHHINLSLDNNQCMGIVLIDVKKAYDSINHDVLFNKLESLGLRGAVLELIRNYFSNRQQAVRINSKVSEWSTIDKGIAQGTNLGPMFFNLMTNDFSCLPLCCKAIRYADDIALIFQFSIDKHNDFEKAVRHDLNIIDEYHTINGMSINANKSKFLIIHRKSQFIPLNCIELCNNQRLQRVTSARYLGLIIDENASLEVHVECLYNKLRATVAILSKLKWILPINMLRKVYMAHFHSHLHYLPSVYGVVKKEAISKVQTLQNRALKHVFKLPYLTPTSDVFKIYAINILPVKGVIFLSTTCLVNKIHKAIVSTNINLPKIARRGRSEGKFKASKFKSDFLKRDISFCGVQLFNNLPSEIRNSENHETFKKKTKDYLSSNISCLLDLRKFSLLEFPKNNDTIN